MTTLPLLVLAMLAAAAPAAGQDPFKDQGETPVAGGKAAGTAPAQALPPAEVDTAQGGPTVVCDGKGGYRVDMKGKQVLPHGACLKVHELSHLADLQGVCPAGCKGQVDGVAHPWDDTGGRCPAFKDQLAFWTWRVGSECKAYTAERRCLHELFEKASGDAKGSLRARVKSVRKSLSYWDARGRELTPPIPCPQPD